MNQEEDDMSHGGGVMRLLENSLDRRIAAQARHASECRRGGSRSAYTEGRLEGLKDARALLKRLKQVQGQGQNSTNHNFNQEQL